MIGKPFLVDNHIRNRVYLREEIEYEIDTCEGWISINDAWLHSLNEVLKTDNGFNLECGSGVVKAKVKVKVRVKVNFWCGKGNAQRG